MQDEDVSFGAVSYTHLDVYKRQLKKSVKRSEWTRSSIRTPVQKQTKQ